MSHDEKKLLFILEKIEDIESFIQRFKNIETLLDDKMGFDATLMCLLQIGENLYKLSNSYDELDKDDIKGAYDVRNFIAHDYEGVNKSIVESILRYHLPELKVSILSVVRE